MEAVILTLFNLATLIKWVSETSEVALENKSFINQIFYSDPFYRKIPFSRGISAISQNYLIILSCSFFDEFEKEFTPSKYPEYSEKILQVKRIVKPAIKRIKKWDGLKAHRNNILSHNLRINGISIFEFKESIEYNIPTTNDEFKLLADLIVLISQNISPVFGSIVDEIDFNNPIIDHISLKSEHIDCNAEFDRIKAEILNNIDILQL